MNMWIIVGIIASVLLIGGFAVANIVTADAEQGTGTFSCSTCGNSCTAESNCGLATCGVVNGEGSCGCGR